MVKPEETLFLLAKLANILKENGWKKRLPEVLGKIIINGSLSKYPLYDTQGYTHAFDALKTTKAISEDTEGDITYWIGEEWQNTFIGELLTQVAAYSDKDIGKKYFLDVFLIIYHDEKATPEEIFKKIKKATIDASGNAVTNSIDFLKGAKLIEPDGNEYKVTEAWLQKLNE